MQKLLRKLSPATVCPELLKRLDAPGAPSEVVLYDVYGIANNFEIGSTDKGNFVKFKGQFEARTTDGEVYVSGAVFLQQPYEDMLFGQLEGIKGQDPNGSVQFGCRVSIVPPAKGKVSSTGYEYRCTPLLQSAESPLDSVRALVSKASEALALPATTSKVKSASAK